jgi:hypothetical protein
MTLIGKVRYGCNQASTKANIEIKGNPCMSATFTTNSAVSTTLTLVTGPNSAVVDSSGSTPGAL